MRKLFLLGIMVAIYTQGAAQNSASLKNQIEKLIPFEQTQNIIQTLASDDTKGRETGTPGFDKAAAFVISELQKHHITPFLNKDFKVFYKHPNSSNFYNIVGVIKSKKATQKPIILSAHLDHLGISKKDTPGIDTIFNGANDDASGVTAILQLAQFLAKNSFDRDIILAFFSGEEMGLLGSKALAQQLKNQRVTLDYLINFEMIGNAMQSGAQEAYLTGFDLSNMAQEINKAAEKPFVVKVDIAEKYKLFFRSDNYSFYQIYQIPAHTLSTFDFPKVNHYHQLDDEVKNLDVKSMNTTIRNVAYSIYRLLKTNTKIVMKPELLIAQ